MTASVPEKVRMFEKLKVRGIKPFLQSNQGSFYPLADCTKCEDIVNGRAYLAHECDEQSFWVCQWIQDQWTSVKKICAPCTIWSQADLTCVHADGPCEVQTTLETIKSTSTTPPVIDSGNMSLSFSPETVVNPKSIYRLMFGFWW